MDETKEFFFENEEEARNLLENSRKQIDEIDNDLIDLIYRRTSLAKGIVFAKQYLGMEIYDKNREKSIHDKVNKLASDKNIDEEILSQIMDMLTILSKNEQKEILRRNENG
ncbi:chorismate mutase [Methanobrevibacter sp. OttesenSCG-928-K11]|nr:chorismate mutase [Methanobrevibacter sp. OttesenSCG-928-K11]MDL2270474.1 chorismate mutase [Methanobrevibacter sp. OttesenSCG-928-I08]